MFDNINGHIEKNQLILFLHSIDEGFLLLDASWTVVDMNLGSWQKMGFQLGQQSIGAKFLEVFPSVRNTDRFDTYKEVMRTGVPASIDQVFIKNELGKSFFYFHIYKVGDGLGIIVRDITEEKQQELELIKRNKQLSDLSAHLQTARDQERAAIAREIHDELGQDLTALKFELHWLEQKMLPDQSLLREKSRELIKTADNMIQVVRKITSKLRLEYLETHSLPEALKLKLKEFNKMTGIDTSISVESGEIEIFQEAAIVLYRILQEALTNIARHAGASKAEVTYFCDGDSAFLSIMDDGRGIGKEELNAPGAYGLIGMRERCSNLKGKLKITGSLGQGTLVEVVLPLL
ncbi:MAG: PAS domain-containing protein [Spirochaetales bacterium]|nr:PAS domain-containing protein [Spirochaetales bacterium]